MNLITEYVAGPAIVPGKMSQDETRFKSHDGSLHVFVVSGLASDNPDNAPCCACSLRHQPCSGARCMPTTRLDGELGYFRRCEDRSKEDMKKVEELLVHGINLCNVPNKDCEGCGCLMDHSCPNRILLQTFQGDKAWNAAVTYANT